MEEITKQKLAINAANAWKMWSNRATVAMGALWTAYFSLPVDYKAACDVCGVTQHDVQMWFSTSLHVPLSIVATAATAATVVLRVWPQKSISPAVAAAKSEDAPQS